MLEVKAKIREWGRSLGIVLPKEEILKEGLKKDDTVTVLIARRKNVLKETFGIIKFKRSTDEILNESDRETWDE